MNHIFEITDKTGRKIYLSRKQCAHINKGHPNINIEEIKQTLTNPLKILAREQDDLFDYYSYFKHKNLKSKYLKVVVKYLNGKGFVVTSYFVRNIK